MDRDSGWLLDSSEPVTTEKFPNFGEIMQATVREYVGRDLTASETKTMEWLAGWEDGTRANVMKLIRDAYRFGKNEKSKSPRS